MKQIIISIVFIFAITSTCFAEQFVAKKFFSESLKQEKTYYISYPTGYNESDTTIKYPVVLFLHGASVDAQYIATQFESYSFLFKLVCPNLFSVIFVIADGSAEPYLGSFYTNSTLYGNFEDYIENDLYSEIKTNYHTYSQRAKWSIMGHSMGGYGSMKIALKHPEKFIGVSSLSGPLHTTYYDDLLPLVLAENGGAAPYNFTYQGSITKLMFSMAGAFSPNTDKNPPVDFPITTEGTIDTQIVSVWNENNPINMIKDLVGKPNLSFFIYCGGKDEYKLLPENELFVDSLIKYDQTYTKKFDADGDHVNSLSTSFPLGLNYLYNLMDTSKIDYVQNISNLAKASNDYIYPNPVLNQLSYKSTSWTDIEDAALISSQGNIIEYLDIENLRNGIAVNYLKSGLYILKVNYKNGFIATKKFIKLN
jgi:S-formylglutathione hydrolase FrmB